MMILRGVAIGVVAAALLAGCTAKTINDRSVVGPDLPVEGPFAGAHEVVITDTRGNGEDAGKAQRIDIVRNAATLVNVFGNTSKPFNAGVGYWRFMPVVAETNNEAKTYWLASFNLTRTADRSVYMIFRFPKDAGLAPGSTSDAVEYATIDCSDLDVARHPADYYAPKKDGETRPEPPLDPVPEAGACEFNSLHELQVMVPLMLKKYDQIRHYDDAPELYWQPVHVEVK